MIILIYPRILWFLVINHLFTFKNTVSTGQNKKWLPLYWSFHLLFQEYDCLICEFFQPLIHSAISLIWVEVLRIVRTFLLSFHGAPITEFISALFTIIAEVNNIFIILYLFYRRYESSKKWKFEWFGINEPMDEDFVSDLA